MRALRPILALAAVAWAAPAPVAAQVAYMITDLGVLTNGQVEGLNAAGQICGFNTYPSGANGFRAGLGVLVNSPAANLGGDSDALAINASGQVTGVGIIGGEVRAFRTTATGNVATATDLGVLPGFTASFGYGINASGQVSGYCLPDVGNAARAFRTTSTGVITPESDLGSLGGTNTQSWGINASGQVSGDSDLPGDVAHHAYRTAPNGPITPASDLGSFGGDSYAMGINDLGQVIGFSFNAAGTFTHGFRTSPTGLISDPGADLGPMTPIGINNMGLVVGIGPGGAVLYDTSLQNLNLLIPSGSGWVLDYAAGINDNGLIAGAGRLNGVTHAFLLTPIPEPSSLALAGVVAAGGWFVRRRRMRS